MNARKNGWGSWLVMGGLLINVWGGKLLERLRLWRVQAAGLE